MINLTQHVATPEQRSAGVIDLDNETRLALTDLLNINELPDLHELQRRAHMIVSLLIAACDEERGPSGADVMIGGAPYLMSVLAEILKAGRWRPHYAFSRRISEDKHLADGTVEKVSRFKHEGFVAA